MTLSPGFRSAREALAAWLAHWQRMLWLVPRDQVAQGLRRLADLIETKETR